MVRLTLPVEFMHRIFSLQLPQPQLPSPSQHQRLLGQILESNGISQQIRMLLVDAAADEAGVNETAVRAKTITDRMKNLDVSRFSMMFSFGCE